jgi:hypothetical protein
MTVAINASRDAAQAPELATTALTPAGSSAHEHRSRIRRAAPALSNRFASDDEILGIDSAVPPARAGKSQLIADIDASNGGAETGAPTNDTTDANSDTAALAESARDSQTEPHFQAALDSNPELRRAWQDVQSYRQAFATPEEARGATALLGDLNRMDALFFSRRPEDHVELACAVATLDPAAFASLAQAMNYLAAIGASSDFSSSAHIIMQSRMHTQLYRRPVFGRALSPVLWTRSTVLPSIPPQQISRHRP